MTIQRPQSRAVGVVHQGHIESSGPALQEKDGRQVSDSGCGYTSDHTASSPPVFRSVGVLVKGFQHGNDLLMLLLLFCSFLRGQEPNQQRR